MQVIAWFKSECALEEGEKYTMKLNGVEMSVSKYISEELGSEIVLYSEEEKKVIVLNHTASLIWKTIIENYENEKNLSTSDIAEGLLKKYDISREEIENIYSDVNETINLFFQASLLKDEKPVGDSVNEEIPKNN